MEVVPILVATPDQNPFRLSLSKPVRSMQALAQAKGSREWCRSLSMVRQPLRNRPRIQQVLLREHARGQLIGVITGQYRHDGLVDDRASVQIGGH